MERLPEKTHKFVVLAPAKDLEAASAAIAAGANAIYIGLQHFNARKRATNINLCQLKALCDYAKSKNVSIFVTLNSLLTTRELPFALNYAYKAYKAGAAGVIVSDIGLLGELKKHFPFILVHASTQLTIHNRPMLDFLKALGATQVNYLRELSSDELRPMLSYAHKIGLKNELFVHGAYCIANSGICYFSTHLYDNSGNRGECLQPCRRNYFTSSESSPKAVMNLKDNCSLSNLKLLSDMGVDTIKIEGRIKDASYVWATTTSYANEDKDLTSSTFNRGFSDSYLLNSVNNNMFQPSPISGNSILIGTLHHYSPKDKSAYLAVSNTAFVPTLKNQINSLLLGQLNFYENSSSGELNHIASMEIQMANYSETEKLLCCQGEFIGKLKSHIKNGHKVYLQMLPKGYLEAKKSFYTFKTNNMATDYCQNKIPLSINLSCKVGRPINLSATILPYSSPFGYEYKTVCSSTLPIELAKSTPTTCEVIKEQLSRLGETPFYIEEICFDKIDEEIFIPKSLLNKLRIEFTSELLSQLKDRTNFKAYQSSSTNKKNCRPKIAILSSDIEDSQLLENEDILFLKANSSSDFSLFKENIIPWVGPYLPEYEFEKLLKAVKKYSCTTATGNMAFGYSLTKANIDWIATPTINVTNSKTVKTLINYNQTLKGLFLSDELSHSQLQDIFLENGLTDLLSKNGVKIFYKAFGPHLLMTTANCIYQNIKGCLFKKSYMDSHCYTNCKHYSKLIGEKGEQLHLIKEPLSPSTLYSQTLLADLKASKNLLVDYLLLDFTKMEFFDLTSKEKENIISLFKNGIEDSSQLPKNYNYQFSKKGFKEEIDFTLF